MCKHHIVYSRKPKIHHVQIIFFKWLLTLLITYWYLQTKEMWQTISCQRSEQQNIMWKTKSILNSSSLIYLGCNPPWYTNGFAPGITRGINVELVSILPRTSKENIGKFPRGIFFDVILMGKNSTPFQHTLFDVILNWWANNQCYLDVLST